MFCRAIDFSYGQAVKVLDGLTVDFPSGTTALLGPNGAGKSTLLSLLASAAMPQAGAIGHEQLVLDRSRGALGRWRRAVGWVPQRIDAIPGMTCAEQVAYMGWLKGIRRSDASGAALEALHRVGLSERATTRVSRLSGGQLRRVGIASALVHSSRVVIMDEPLAGLDPAQRARMVGVVKELRGVDCIISTHQTEDLTELANHVKVMDRGLITWEGTTEEFMGLGDGTDDARRIAHAYSRLIEPEE